VHSKRQDTAALQNVAVIQPPFRLRLGVRRCPAAFRGRDQTQCRSCPCWVLADIVNTVISISQLEAQLQHFDGKHVDSLFRVGRMLPLESTTIDQLLELAERSDPPIQIAATWLLKYLQSQKITFSSSQITKLVEQLNGSGPWESRLQLLQMLPQLVIPTACTETLFQVLLLPLSGRNKFIRAWAYTGLHALATQHPSYVKDVVPLLEQALEDEAASVGARVRQLEPLE
jgi:hypothetical protein